MLDIAALVTPVFGLIGLGFLAARLGLLTQRAGEGLAEYVFTLAIPFLLFRTILAAQFPPTLPWAYWAVLFRSRRAVLGDRDGACPRPVSGARPRRAWSSALRRGRRTP